MVATVSNTGGTTLYNVEAKVKGSNMSESSYYIGTLEAGKNKNVDIITKATALYSKDKNDNLIYVTYENKAGDEFEIKTDITYDPVAGVGTIPVIAKDISNLVEVKNDTSNQKLKDDIKVAIIVVVIISAVALIIIVRHIRRKKIEKMFE